MAHNKKNTFYLILISTLLLTSCGFKKLEKLNGNYNVQEVSIKGDRRVGYILKNEITTVFNFVRGSDWYDKNEGIYVIGGSFGSWLSLGILADKNLSKDIKGVIFLSPSVAPHKSTVKYANEIIKFKLLFPFLMEKRSKVLIFLMKQPATTSMDKL